MQKGVHRGNGMPLMRVSDGNCNHPTCIFLHGFLGTKEDWYPMWELLSKDHFCIAYDLPGHGHSPNISSNYLQILEDEIRQDSFGKKPVLIGYSLGGRIALQLADKNPSLYSHVIALSAHAGIIEEKERASRLDTDLEWIDKLHRCSMRSFVTEWYQQPLFHSLCKKPDLLDCITKKRHMQEPLRMADVLAMLSLGRQNPIIFFHPRTLFLYGEEDEKYQKYYNTLARNATVRAVEHSGHVVHLENPVACAERILQWLEANP